MIQINKYAMQGQPCSDAFERMFWACFWAIDFRVGSGGVQIDLLPDFIGWMMMVSALTSILDLSPVVAKLRIYASILLVLSLFDIVQWQDGDPAFASPMYFWDLMYEILLCILIWGLGGLIRAMAEAVGDLDIASKAPLYRWIYLGLVLVPFLVPLQYLRPLELLFWVGVGIMGLTLITWILMLKLLKDTAAMCRRRR